MKKFFLIGLIAGYFFILTNVVNSQPIEAQISVFEPLPALDLAAFVFSNSLEGSPRFFAVDITPVGLKVILETKIFWNRGHGDQFFELLSFVTQPFISGVVYNDQIGSSILIENIESNSELIQENLNIGVPSGRYEVAVNVSEFGNPLNNFTSNETVLEFVNPSQTLAIRAPEAGSTQDIGSVYAEWDNIVGASGYVLKAGVRTNPNQSIEESLNSGTPLINNRSTGLLTSVNLRDYLDREWLPGQEIILQVKAEVPSPGGNNELFSDPVNFFMRDSNPETMNRIGGYLFELLRLLSENLDQNLIDLLESGGLGDLSQITLDGKIISEDELIVLLNNLLANRENIIRINYVQQ
ncbi:MAG: hypothetical protein V1720_02530 [bacterium]